MLVDELEEDPPRALHVAELEVHDPESPAGAAAGVRDRPSGEARVVYRPKDQIGWLSASPSGRSLAVVSSFSSDRMSTTGDLLLLSAADGQARRIDTEGADITFTAWQSESEVLIAGIRSLETVLALTDAETSRTRVLWAATDTTLWDSIPGEWNRANMLSAGDVARAIAAVVDQPPHLATEELVIGHVAGRL